MKLRTIVRVALLAPAAVTAAVAAAAPGKSCHLPGAEEALRCVTLAVPLDYSKPSGSTLKLHVTVAPAFRESARGDPVFLLAGGPGQAGSDVLMVLNSTLRRVRATRDVVIIDQRGTGKSGRLACPHEKNEDSMSQDEIEAAVKRCIASVRQPYAAFSTANAARDMEQVRKALGYDSINLLGVSYGTRLAQHYVRLYPGQVRAMVLDGVAAPDQIIPAAGQDGEAALKRVFADCAADKACNGAFPAIGQQFDALRKRVEAGIDLEFPDPRTARPSRVRMTPDRFYSTLHQILYSPDDSRRLPFLINSAYNNRWQPFIARRNAGSDFSVDGPVSTLMHLAVVCAEDVPRLGQAQRSAEQATLAAPLLDSVLKACAIMDVAPAAPAPATIIKAPVLMLSGALDPVTPPRRAEAAGKFMSAAQHLVVANAGHGILSLGCAPRLLREFLDRPSQKVAAKCLDEIPAPTFQLGSAGPQP
ncbi:alpha/beta fold hydrolase [Massilia sp. PAMC28688]|uniref:alpha/beta fold hydrolase n=1 Tax=Massilia sp. PAMC28688 TaxID=2861283 RepID=UPI001E5D1C22|nr:alpha/beta fold hydrolase [Massilia sp. PAMC28688]